PPSSQPPSSSSFQRSLPHPALHSFPTRRSSDLMLAGNVVVLLLFLINAVFRGAGDATIAMRSLWIASACNMILGPLFIFGVGAFPRLGVTGAAVGTTIGRSIGVLNQISQLVRRNGRIQIQRAYLR